MSLFSILFGDKPKPSAQVAKERLQLVITHQRSGPSGKKDFLPEMQKELIAVISRYVSIAPENIKVLLEKQGNYEVLEVNIVLPDSAGGA